MSINSDIDRLRKFLQRLDDAGISLQDLCEMNDLEDVDVIEVLWRQGLLSEPSWLIREIEESDYDELE